MKHKRLLMWTAVGIGIAVMITASVLLTIYLMRPRTVLPPAIAARLGSTVFVPRGDGVQVERSSITYNPSEKLLFYTVRYADRSIVVSEQNTPDTFTDIPQLYSKYVTGLGQYDAFESLQGTVYLTTAKTNTDQAAVLNAKGTLLFAHLIHSKLTTAQWRALFSTLQVQS